MAIYRGTGATPAGTTIPELITQAETAATNAAASATSAATSEANALAIYGNTVAMNAAVTTTTTNATNAAASAGTAGTASTSAGTSATNAATSATSAANSASAAGLSATNAATSEANALTSANNAATSATTASGAATTATAASTSAGTSATNAATSETNAAGSVASALAIYGSIGAVNTAVTNAQTAATAASTSATNSANSATTAATQATTATTQANNASVSASAAQVSATNAANYQSAAASSATASAGSAASALAIYGSTSAMNTAVTNAQTSANLSAASATASATSATASAASATSAATSATSAAASAANLSAITVTGGTASLAPMAGGIPVANAKGEIRGDWIKSYPAIASTMPAITIVDYCFHLAKDDTDKGAWRKRKGQSWRSEARTTGKYLGVYATALAAVNAQTGAVGDYFYNSTSGAFEAVATITGTVPSATAATSTATYRAGREDYPTNALVTAEAGRVIIWDLDGAQPTMWMVFVVGAGNHFGSATGLTSISALNDVVCFGVTSNGLIKESFIADCGSYYGVTIAGRRTTTIGNRNNGLASTKSEYPVIINGSVNDVAITILPDAPTDEYGMPVPTIWVGTSGGISRIAHDGTVSSVILQYASSGYKMYVQDNYLFCADGFSLSSGVYSSLCAIPTANLLSGGASNQVLAQQTGWVKLLGGSFYGVIPRIDGISSQGNVKNAVTTLSGISVLKPNYSTSTATLFANITSTYNTGWMVGDIRRSWLADGVTETVSGAELVTNGTFATDVLGWTAFGSTPATLTWSAGTMVVTSNAALTYSGATQAITGLTVGKTYRVAYDEIAGTNANRWFAVGTTAGGQQTLVVAGAVATNRYWQFTATATTHYVSVIVWNTGDTYQVDNISVQLAEADRSVKAKPLSIVGSITKTATAGGRSIYSGFSASNYLQEASHADWNALGTGDFSIIMSGVKWGTAGTTRNIFSAGAGSTAGSIFLQCTAANALYLMIHDGTVFVTAANSTIPFTDTAEHVLEIKRGTFSGVASTVQILVDGIVVASAVLTLTISNATGFLRIGNSQHTSSPWTGGSVANVRISATAPTAEQSKHIAATENALNGGQPCLLSNSSTVSLLDYDSQADLLEVVNGTATDFFSGLARVGSVTTTAGITGATSEGQVPKYALLKSGTTNKFWTAERNISAELQEQYKETKKTQQYSFTSSGTTWALPKGWKAQGMAFNTTDGTFLTTATQTFDGFLWSLAGLTTAKAYQVNLVEV